LTTSAEPACGARDDAGAGEGADQKRDGGGALQGYGEAGAGQHRHDRIAHGGAQTMAQHVAIGAFDAGLHHAGGKQHQRHGAGQMQKDDGTAHFAACMRTGRAPCLAWRAG
jgi:hypothetical protein